MKLSSLAVKRPVTVVMAVLLVLILGGIAIVNIPLELMPDLNLPVAVVVTEYEGAGPEEIESLVSEPIEEAVQAVGGVNSVMSVSGEEESMVIVEFNWGTNMDFAVQDIREQIDQVYEHLPDDVQDPYTIEYDPTEMPILEYGFSSETRDLAELRSLVDDDIVSELERIDGIAAIDTLGGLEREIQVALNSNRMRTLGISADDVMESIYASNLDLPAGDVVWEEEEQSMLRVLGEFQSLEEIKDVVVPAGDRVYYLEEIAEIKDTYKDMDQTIRVDGQDSVGISLQSEAEANTVRAAERVKTELAEITEEYDELEVINIFDESNYVLEAISTVVGDAVLGGILAIVVLYLFLLNISTTIIIAVTIPVSIVATFFLMYYSEMTINIMALGGLALGAGMLVDNSIVVLESIFRHRLNGKAADNAAIDGTSEVGVAIAASTLTTLMVFLPVVFIDGIAGEIFRDLSFTVAFSLLVSLLVSVTLIPMLSSRMFADVDIEALKKKQKENKSTKLLNNLADKYGSILKQAINYRKIVLLLAVVIFAGGIFIYNIVGSEFLPDVDEGQINVDIEMPAGTAEPRTNRMVEELEEEVRQIPEVENYQAIIGSGGMEDIAEININLVDMADREQSTDEVISHLRQVVADIDTAEIEVTSVSTLTGGDEAGDAPIHLDVVGDDTAQVENFAEELRDEIAAIEGTTEVSTGIERVRPEIQFDVDRRKAGMYGLTAGQIAQTIDAAISGRVVSRYNDDDDNIDVLVRYEDGVKEDLAALERLPITTPTGNTIPVHDVAELKEGYTPGEINRIDQEAAVSIYSELEDEDLGTVIERIDKQLAEVDFPDGISYQYGSETEWMDDAFQDLTLALLLSIILVYMVLASQFESLTQPFILIFSIPFGMVGVIIGLFLTGRTINVASFIGIIMLVGIVVNNAIVLLDYINQKEAESEVMVEAVIEASKVRLRPILMTTATTVLAMFPLSLGIGEGAEIQAPIATAVIGGLLVSTLSTLVIIPVLYTIFYDYIFAIDIKSVKDTISNKFKG